jgi:hypothetical protein
MTNELGGFKTGETVQVFDGLKGQVVGIVHGSRGDETQDGITGRFDDDYLSVDVVIPEGHPGFPITGVTENFWLLPSEAKRPSTPA